MTATARPEDVLRFWFEELTPEDWYAGGEALDARVRERLGHAWEEAMDGAYGLWLTTPKSALAYVILMDQAPRNIWRGDRRSFASDAIARAAAKGAIARDWDLRIPEPDRQFFYMPLMHSENLVDQDRCVRLFASRMPKAGHEQLPHAQAHREQIRRFGRFPMRNEALGRRSTPAEEAWLKEGGYRAMLKEFGVA
jgi:uncharacterized protein (DUF924 family)